MKSWTEELPTRDHSFEIGGEVFHWRDLNWDDFAALAAQEEEFTAKDATTAKDNLQFLTDRIVFFLDPKEDAPKRFKALLKRKENPVPHYAITELHTWLWEQISQHPTKASGGSSNGASSTETSSQDESS